VAALVLGGDIVAAIAMGRNQMSRCHNGETHRSQSTNGDGHDGQEMKLKDWLSLNVGDFHGNGTPMKAASWLHTMEKYMEALELSPRKRVLYVAFQLKHTTNPAHSLFASRDLQDIHSFSFNYTS
jgi:hypothetical protein